MKASKTPMKETDLDRLSEALYYWPSFPERSGEEARYLVPIAIQEIKDLRAKVAAATYALANPPNPMLGAYTPEERMARALLVLISERQNG